MPTPHTPSALIEWRDDFRTGIDDIDHEHQNMIEAINALGKRLDNDSGANEIQRDLSRIHELIEAHFALEEMMMRKHSYAGFREHKAHHDQLLDDIRDIMDDVEETHAYTPALRDALKTRISEWFGVHFRTLDRDLHTLTGI